MSLVINDLNTVCFLRRTADFDSSDDADVCRSHRLFIFYFYLLICLLFLQCFDTVGFVIGKASGTSNPQRPMEGGVGLIWSNLQKNSSVKQ